MTATDKPASFLRNTDPATKIKGMPPNFGEDILPHVVTFRGILSTIAKVYRSSDEAIRDSRESARFMRNDPTIMECLEQRQRSTALLNWHLEPEDQKNSQQKELCEHLKAIIEATPRFMQYRENLLHALWYGKYGVQHRYRWKKVRGQMRLCVDRWLPVNGDKIVFRFDDGTGMYDPDQVGIRVGAGFTSSNDVAKKWSENRKNKVEPTDFGMAYFLEPWERRMLAIHKHMIEDGDYDEPRSAEKIHGLGIRSRIYWTWYQKQESLAWLMEFLERSAFGFEIWYFPWGDDEAKKKVEKAAKERIGQGRNIVFMPRPADDSGGMAYGVDKIEANMAGADTLERILREYFGHQIKRYILGQTLTTEADATGLGSGLASVHLDTYLQIIRYDATNLEETLTTELVEPLKAFNFPRFRDVSVRFRIDTEAADVEGKLSAWERAWTMGVKLRSQDVMDLIGASKPDSDEDILLNPDVENARQQMRQQQQQSQVAMVQGGLGEGDITGDNSGSETNGNLPSGAANLPSGGTEDTETSHNKAENNLSGAGSLPVGENNFHKGQFDPDQLERGIAHEMEHTDDPEMALKIAMDNLAKHPDYYETLERMGQDSGESEEHDGSGFEKYSAINQEHRTTVAVDLDGTLATYEGWQGEEHFGRLRPNAKKVLSRFKESGWTIIIFTTRGDKNAIAHWLDEHDLPWDYINENPNQPEGTSGKVIADYYIDDRAIDGSQAWNTIEEVLFCDNAGKGKVQAYSADSFQESLKDHLGQTTADEYTERVAKAVSKTDTDPSDNQKASGNYRKGKCRIHGLEIAIENPAGSVRRGQSSSGESWSVTMPAHYGYIKQTESEADGDHVDVFLGPDLDSEAVFIIDQLTPVGRFDEHKCMVGWKSAKEATAAYWQAYSEGYKGKVGAVVPMTMPQFKQWLKHGDTGRRAADQVERYRKLSDFRETDHPRGQPDNPGEFAPKTSGQGNGGKHTETATAAPGGHQPDPENKRPQTETAKQANPLRSAGGDKKARPVTASTTSSGVKHEVRIVGGAVWYRNSADENAQWSQLPSKTAKWFQEKVRESADRAFERKRQREEGLEIRKVRQQAAEEKIIAGLEYGPIKGNTLRRRLKIDPNTFVDAYFALADAGKISQDPRDGTIYLGADYPNLPQESKKRKSKEGDWREDLKRFASQIKVVIPENTPEQIAAEKEAKEKKEAERVANEKAVRAEERRERVNEKQKRLDEVAEAHDISAGDLLGVSRFVLDSRLEEFNKRENAKDSARDMTGLTQNDVRRVENSGADYSTLKTHPIRFDKAAVTLARDYPGVIGDPDDGSDNLSAGLWELLREGKLKSPALYDPEILDEAASYVVLGKQGGESSIEEILIPFARPGRQVERYRRYADWKQQQEQVRYVASVAGEYYAERYAKRRTTGETKVVNGRTYRLNENHRWERVHDQQSKSPTIAISGDEFGKSLDSKTLRTEALDYWRNNLKGKKFKNKDTGHEIAVSRDGIAKTLSYSGDIRRTKLVAKLPELLQEASYSFSENPHKSNAKYWRYHSFSVDVVIEGKETEVDFLVGEDANGNWFYQFARLQETEKPGPSKGPLPKQASLPLNAGLSESESDHSDTASNRIIGRSDNEVKRENYSVAIETTATPQSELAKKFAAAFSKAGW